MAQHPLGQRARGKLVLLLRGGRLGSGTIEGLEARRAEALVEEVLGHPSETTFVAVLQGSLDPASDEHHAAVRRAFAPLRADPRVLSVVTPEQISRTCTSSS